MSDQLRSTGQTVRLRRTLTAAPSRVYEAWLDPAILAQWISPVGHAVVSVDPRPGGRFRIVMVGEGREIEHVGRYRELVNGHRLVFTWRSPYTGGDSVVTVELEAVGRGTNLTLIHEGLPEEQVGPHSGGWVAILDRLAVTVASLAPDEAGGAA
jgi:uncharacterized protein YndB with AHSA1/START domain